MARAHVRTREPIKSAHHPFEFEQDGHRDERRSDSAATTAEGRCFAPPRHFGSLMKNRASTFVSIAFTGHRRAERREKGSRIEVLQDRRGFPRDGAVSMPAKLAISAFWMGRRTRNFTPSASSMASIFAPAPMPSRRRSVGRQNDLALRGDGENRHAHPFQWVGMQQTTLSYLVSQPSRGASGARRPAARRGLSTPRFPARPVSRPAAASAGSRAG